MIEPQVRRLVLRGIMPSIAEKLVDEAEAMGRLATPGEVEDEAEALPFDVQLERARVWWVYQPAVLDRFRRLLDARVLRHAA